jgi:hypothetical protein
MRIGILTFHRAHNYGAVLQCYALQEVLSRMGYRVEIVDYRQPFIESFYRIRFPKRFFFEKIIRLDFVSIINYLRKSMIPEIKRKFIFKKFVDKNLVLSGRKYEDDIFLEDDVYIIGSDQVWSYYCTKRYEKLYWGDFKRKSGSKLIGYAISSVGDFDEYIDSKTFCENLRRFDSLSVRETAIKDYIKNNFDVNVDVTIDPTLLTTKDLWENVLNNKWSKRKYVAVYELRIPKDDHNYVREKAQMYAKKHSLEVVDLSRMGYSVNDFLSIISNAELVFTTSFHAVVFSLIFSTDFFAFDIGDGKEIRYKNLLESLNLEHLLLNKKSNVEDIIHYDRLAVQQKLKMLREESMNFLLKSLS